MAMSYLLAVPEYVDAAATELASLGSTITAANAAAGPTWSLLSAGADEVSEAVASVFAGHARAFQALSTRAAAFHQQFVQMLNASGGSYAGAEATGVSLLQNVQQGVQAAIAAPAQILLGSMPVGGLTNLLPPSLSAYNLGGLVNVPYNLFADVVNIPYYESLALQEYAYALGPAGSVGGVPGWIPPGATIANGGVQMVNGQPYYAVGGTGNWFMESMGNTWGWDNGNWPQLDAILHFLLPFPATESIAEQVQVFAQAELIDGTAVNTQFESANPFAYLGGWLHGDTPLQALLAGTTYPTTLTDTIGHNVSAPFGEIINVNPTGTGITNSPGPDVAIWSGQPAQLNLLAPLQAFGANMTATPAQDPIMFPNPNTVLSSAIQLGTDFTSDFNPFVTGSFVYWGAPNDYSFPSVVGGTIQAVTGIPNQFPLANYGAEPISGYTDGPSSLLTGLPEGGQYLAQGLLGYLNPNIYAQAITNDIAALSDTAALLNNVPLIGYLGLG